MEGIKPPLYRWQRSLFWWVGVFCIREVDRCCHSSWHGAYLPISLPPLFCLALPTMTQFHEWLHLSWDSLSASINQQWHHSLHLMYVFLLRSVATWCYLRSSPIFCGCSSRCPWQKSQLLIFLPQGSFTGRLSGDHLTIVLLWHPLHFTSYRGSLVWGRTGTPVPCMTVAHTQGNTNLWCDEKKLVLVEDACPSVLVHHCKRECLSWSDAPPPKSPFPTYPWLSSFP